jgi:hypothetical protein
MIRAGDIVWYYRKAREEPLAAIVAAVHLPRTAEALPLPAVSAKQVKQPLSLTLCVILEDGTTTNKRKVPLVAEGDTVPSESYCTERNIGDGLREMIDAMITERILIFRASLIRQGQIQDIPQEGPIADRKANE